MTLFSYQATDKKGNQLSGQVEATDRSAVIKGLTNRNLRPTIIREVAKVSTIVGADVNELAPKPGLHACDFLAAKLAYKILSHAFLTCKQKALPKKKAKKAA